MENEVQIAQSQQVQTASWAVTAGNGHDKRPVPGALEVSQNPVALKLPCVLPVSAADALAWAEGRLDDLDLVLNAKLRPEAVFVVNLPNLRSYRQTLRLVANWRERGAVCMIARTGSDLVEDGHCEIHRAS
ncbi:MAG TPA: hypothetical protein VG146_01820 [Verrucomicrobiae bacterium]|nr:hypothetical protein [Verrucomicrobiae bacterium]